MFRQRYCNLYRHDDLEGVNKKCFVMFGHRYRQEPVQAMAGIAVTWTDSRCGLPFFLENYPQFGQSS